MSDDPDLARLRARMDELNQRLAAVLHERARLCRVIGARKRELAQPAVDDARETAMLDAIARTAGGDGFDADALRRIFAAIFAESRQIVRTAGQH